MESCHILRLPDEIHVAVAGLLPGNAIKSLRATCTKLNAIASPYLFPALYLSCHQLDLDVFRLVTSNPLLISGVKELVIDDTTLSPRLADWEVYRTMASYSHMWPERKNAYHWPQKFDEAGRIWSDEPDKEFYNLFTSVLKGHHENRQSHADLIALRQALPLFKSLRSLVISNRTADDCSEIYSGAQSEESSSPVVKMWRRFGATKQERPPFPPRCDWIAPWHGPGSRAEVMQLDFFNDELEKCIKEYGVPPTADEQERRDLADTQSTTRDLASYNWFAEEYFCRVVGREARAVIIALEVLGDPSIRLTEFRVDASLEVGDTSLYQPGLPILLFDSLESPFPPKLLSSFSSSYMTKFHLVLSDSCDPYDSAFIGGKSMDQGNIARLLAAMPQLEDLLLEPHGMKIFSAIPDVTFRRLQRVEFSCGEIDPQKLVGFIRRHASTLKFLTVQYCCIDPDNYEDIWEDVMRDIRHMQDAKALDLYDGQVTGAYVDAPGEGCGKNNTLDLGGPECLVRHWEFMFFSFWRRYHEYPWDFQSDEEGDGASDVESGSEGSENEASGL